MPKTGSRSLQNAFFENRRALRQLGVVYPMVGIRLVNGSRKKHRKLTSVLAGYDPKEIGMPEDWAERLRKETEGAEICVVSDQHFHRFPKPELLLPLFPRDRTRVVVYLREPVMHVVSRYAHGIKINHGMTMNLHEFARFIRWSNADILDRWINTFGRENVVLRRFERASLLGEDIVKDFAHLVRPGLEKVFSNQKYISNASLAGNLLFVKRVLNHFIEERPNRTIYREISELTKLDPKFRGRFFVDQESVNLIASLFSKDCEAVDKRFGVILEPRDVAVEGSLCPDGVNFAHDYNLIRSEAEVGGNLAVLMDHLQDVFAS